LHQTDLAAKLVFSRDTAFAVPDALNLTHFWRLTDFY
jgi:hypothetical protein